MTSQSKDKAQQEETSAVLTDRQPTLRHQNARPVAEQFARSILGEVVAFSIALGAVYVSERLLPKQMEGFTNRLSRSLASWRNSTAADETALAKKILDIGIMNMAGLSGLATQFTLRRLEQKSEEKQPLWYELGRLAAGRLGGTVTALSSLAILETQTPALMQRLRGGVAMFAGGGAGAERFAELFVSNSAQSVGSIGGNVSAQLLFDRLVHAPKQIAR